MFCWKFRRINLGMNFVGEIWPGGDDRKKAGKGDLGTSSVMGKSRSVGEGTEGHREVTASQGPPSIPRRAGGL